MTITNRTQLPRPELRGVGVVTYRCAGCNEPVDKPVWSTGRGWWSHLRPAELTADLRTYHEEHAPIGEFNGR